MRLGLMDELVDVNAGSRDNFMKKISNVLSYQKNKTRVEPGGIDLNRVVLSRVDHELFETDNFILIERTDKDLIRLATIGYICVPLETVDRNAKLKPWNFSQRAKHAINYLPNLESCTEMAVLLTRQLSNSGITKGRRPIAQTPIKLLTKRDIYEPVEREKFFFCNPTPENLKPDPADPFTLKAQRIYKELTKTVGPVRSSKEYPRSTIIKQGGATRTASSSHRRLCNLNSIDSSTLADAYSQLYTENEKSTNWDLEYSMEASSAHTQTGDDTDPTIPCMVDTLSTESSSRTILPFSPIRETISKCSQATDYLSNDDIWEQADSNRQVDKPLFKHASHIGVLRNAVLQRVARKAKSESQEPEAIFQKEDSPFYHITQVKPKQSIILDEVKLTRADNLSKNTDDFVEEKALDYAVEECSYQPHEPAKLLLASDIRTQQSTVNVEKMGVLESCEENVIKIHEWNEDDEQMKDLLRRELGDVAEPECSGTTSNQTLNNPDEPGEGKPQQDRSNRTINTSNIRGKNKLRRRRKAQDRSRTFNKAGEAENLLSSGIESCKSSEEVQNVTSKTSSNPEAKPVLDEMLSRQSTIAEDDFSLEEKTSDSDSSNRNDAMHCVAEKKLGKLESLSYAELMGLNAVELESHDALKGIEVSTEASHNVVVYDLDSVINSDRTILTSSCREPGTSDDKDRNSDFHQNFSSNDRPVMLFVKHFEKNFQEGPDNPPPYLSTRLEDQLMSKLTTQSEEKAHPTIHSPPEAKADLAGGQSASESTTPVISEDIVIPSSKAHNLLSRVEFRDSREMNTHLNRSPGSANKFEVTPSPKTDRFSDLEQNSPTADSSVSNWITAHESASDIIQDIPGYSISRDNEQGDGPSSQPIATSSNPGLEREINALVDQQIIEDLALTNDVRKTSNQPDMTDEFLLKILEVKEQEPFSIELNQTYTPPVSEEWHMYETDIVPTPQRVSAKLKDRLLLEQAKDIDNAQAMEWGTSESGFLNAIDDEQKKARTVGEHQANLASFHGKPANRLVQTQIRAVRLLDESLTTINSTENAADEMMEHKEVYKYYEDTTTDVDTCSEVGKDDTRISTDITSTTTTDKAPNEESGYRRRTSGKYRPGTNQSVYHLNCSIV